MGWTDDEPPVYDDLDGLDASPLTATGYVATKLAVRRILEENQVPPEQRRVLARAFYEDWVATRTEAWERWLERCRERSHDPGDD